MSRRDSYDQSAEGVPFDNTNNDFEADNVQEALEESGVSASPGFSFGKSGNITSGSWLLRPGGVPSNKAGVNISLYNAELTQISVGSENADTYNIEIYQHDGDEINLTLITSVSIVAKRKETFNVTGASLTKDMHIAVKLSSGSAKNVGIDLLIKGSSVA